MSVAVTDGNNSADVIPAHLLFVLLAPQFPSYHPAASILENITEQPVLLLNVRRTISLHPRWRVIVDNDETCSERILLAASDGLLSKTSTHEWWNDESQERIPAFRSDLCRLLQLYYDGGLYLDTDVELLRPYGLGLLAKTGVTAVLDLPKKDVVQSVLAAPARSPIIQRNIELFNAVMKNKRSSESVAILKGGLIGPRLLARSISTMHGPFTSRNSEVAKGLRERLQRDGAIQLLEEIVNHNESFTRGRHRGMMCNVGMYNATSNEWIAYARVKRPQHATACADSFWSKHRQYWPH